VKTKDSEKPQTDSVGGQDLGQVLQEAQRKGDQIAALGRQMTKGGQALADMAEATWHVVSIVSDPPEVGLLKAEWQATNAQVDLILTRIGEADMSATMSTAGSAFYLSTEILAASKVEPLVAAEALPELRGAIDRLQQTSARSADKARVVSLMKSLGLDKAPKGCRSALDQFLLAHDAYASPISGESPSITSLIPMRESIRTVVDQLLQRRPNHRKAKKWPDKILSIADQLKRTSVPQSTVDSWARACPELLKHLSTTKEDDISRQEWHSRLVKSTHFLASFLEGIDPHRLR